MLCEQISQKYNVPFLPFLPVLIAVSVLLYNLHLRSAAQQAEREHNSLKPICQILDLPADTSQEQILGRLATLAGESEEARKARIARLVGLEADWDRIFQRIEHMDSKAQGHALHTISQEYRLASDLPISHMKKFVVRRSRFTATIRPRPHILTAVSAE